MMILTGLVIVVGLAVVACCTRGEFHLLGACIGLTGATLCDLSLPQAMVLVMVCAALIGHCAERLLHLCRKVPDHAGSVIASIDATGRTQMPMPTPLGRTRQWPVSSATPPRTDLMT